MLVLSRLIGQIIVIRVGEEVIQVELCGMNLSPNGHPYRARLGFSASHNVSIDRSEIDVRKRLGVPRK